MGPTLWHPCENPQPSQRFIASHYLWKWVQLHSGPPECGSGPWTIGGAAHHELHVLNPSPFGLGTKVSSVLIFMTRHAIYSSSVAKCFGLLKRQLWLLWMLCNFPTFLSFSPTELDEHWMRLKLKLQEYCGLIKWFNVHFIEAIKWGVYVTGFFLIIAFKWAG